ncbi:putative pectate lyase 7 [Quercus suber]|uniref:Pectate lyase n=1 Tax=Quercus suber TaxID=58331 RepID=A0AAW0IHL6_QUESU
MVIKLSQELIVNSHKTIDARGANVHIAYGAGITIQFVKNVIIHGLHIHDIVSAPGGTVRDSVDHMGFRTASDGDGISIFGSTNIWLDHLSMSNCQDVAFNHFGRGLVQRMPRCRWGFFHVVNNDYTHWLMYAIGGSQHPTIISQGNRFIAPPNVAAKEVTKRDYATQDVWKNWTWRSEGDIMMNGAFFVQSGNPSKKRPYSKKDMIKAKPGTFVTRLTRFSGSLNCKVGRPC